MPRSRYLGKPGKCENCTRYTAISRKPEFPASQKRCTAPDADYSTHCKVCCPENAPDTRELLASVRERVETRFVKQAVKALEALVA